MANGTVINAIQGIRQDDIIIAFMGPTGVGKTNFIDLLTNQIGRRSGHPLRSDIQATRIRHPTNGAANIVLIDTPGFDDTMRTDLEILAMMGSWLEKMYQRDVKLSGVVYLHRITDNRMAGSPLKNLHMFRDICGASAMARVIIVSTMWQRVQRNVGEQRESALKQEFWKPLIENGAGVDRLKESNTEEAWRIVDQLIRSDKNREALLLQEEMVDLGRKLNETTAGQKLYNSLQNLLADQKESLKSLLAQVEKSDDPKLKKELEKEYKKIQDQFQKTFDELNTMKIPLARRAQIFLSRGPRHEVSEEVLEKLQRLKDSLDKINSSKKKRDSSKAEEMEKEKKREREKQERKRKDDEKRQLTEEREKEKRKGSERKRLENEMKQLTKVREKEREMEREKEREIERSTEQERQERRRLEREKEKETKRAAQLEKLLGSLNSKSSTSLDSTTSDASISREPEDPNDFERTRTVKQIHALVSELMDTPEKYRLLTRLEGVVVQLMADFLNQILDQEDPGLGGRKHTMHLLYRFARSAQVFPRCFKLKGVECDLTRSVDEGGFGCIYKGTFRDQAVCVKTIRIYQGGASNGALRAQAAELTLLANTSHPNVLPFYGLYRSREKISRICLVSPWMEGGNLANYLKTCSASLQVPLLLDIASGLNYLHELGIIHSDLKARNVLVSGERAVLADFGISRIAMTQVTTTGAGTSYTANWTAPELFTTRSKPLPTRASDMWSFGCTCYEVMTGDIPFSQYNHEYQLILALKNDHVTPSRPDTDGGPDALQGAPEWLRVLAERCWDFNPEGRPTAGEVYRLISAQLEGKDDRPARDVKFFKLLITERAERAKRRIDHGLIHAVLQQIREDHSMDKERCAVMEQERLASEGQSWSVSRRRQICQVVNYSVLASSFRFP